MGNEIQKAPEITLLRSEMEAAAARVAERAMNTTLDGLSGLLGDAFGGLIGDRVKQWRNRNLINDLVKTKHYLDSLGIPIENAKTLPMGELYAIFDGMSKQDDPQLSDMWATLLANAMNPSKSFVLDPALPKVLEQLSGVDAVILTFYRDAEVKRYAGLAANSKPTSARQAFLESESEKILKVFGANVISASIGNLLRLGLLYVETSFDDHMDLVTVGVNRRSDIVVNASELKDELSHIYYRLNLTSDNIDNHNLVDVRGPVNQHTFTLPYDLTRLASRLLEACSSD